MSSKSDLSIDWTKVKRVLVVKLRSIGDTVLSTPSLTALRRFLPAAEIDILLEDWVAPLLDGHPDIDNVISVGKGTGERLSTALALSRRRYDVAFNLHGGTTATFFTAASRARHRVGFANYQYSFLYDRLLSSAADFWQIGQTHSAEQQLALLGSVGIPVKDRPKSSLHVSAAASERVAGIVDKLGPFALIHPSTAFFTKEWPTENFARAAEFLADRGLAAVAIASKSENSVLERLKHFSAVPILTLDDLTLPEIAAIADRSSVFVGNDSGIAHIAAAVGTPTVVIFGSSNRVHWRPWTDAPNKIVFEEFPCQPCAGYRCEVFGEPKCILSVTTASVEAAIDRVLEQKKAGNRMPAL